MAGTIDRVNLRGRNTQGGPGPQGACWHPQPDVIFWRCKPVISGITLYSVLLSATFARGDLPRGKRLLYTYELSDFMCEFSAWNPLLLKSRFIISNLRKYYLIIYLSKYKIKVISHKLIIWHNSCIIDFSFLY